jgi:hypothetical protein
MSEEHRKFVSESVEMVGGPLDGETRVVVTYIQSLSSPYHHHTGGWGQHLYRRQPDGRFHYVYPKQQASSSEVTGDP